MGWGVGGKVISRQATINIGEGLGVEGGGGGGDDVWGGKGGGVRGEWDTK